MRGSIRHSGDDDKRQTLLQPREVVGAVRNPVFRRLGKKSATCGAHRRLIKIAPRRRCGAVPPGKKRKATMMNGFTFSLHTHYPLRIK